MVQLGSWSFLTLILSASYLSSCGNAPVAYTSAKQQDINVKRPGEPSPETVVLATSGSENSVLKTAIETFNLTAATPPASDFIFVVDSSGSMETIISKFVKGFESIPPSKYPENSRMAVMNMSAHELDNPEMPIAVNAVFPLFKEMYKEIFPDISLNNFKNFMSAEPGYLRFVNANSVENFKSVAKANTLEALLADKFISHQLCENEWFLPGQKNSSQTATCLGAAMQISGWVGIESGLMAVLQMVQKKSQPIFRKNAGAHIVFISDTHDPGNSSFNGYEEYLKKLPTFAILERKIRENSKDVSFVKLHGVVPFTVCDKSEESEKGIYGGSYLKPIEASGGVAVDMCKDEVNYSAVVNQLFDAARKIPPFRLKSSEIKNVSVKVNGQAHADFKIIDNRLVEVNGLLLSEDYSIQIQYDSL